MRADARCAAAERLAAVVALELGRRGVVARDGDGVPERALPSPCGGPPPSCDPRASCRASEPSKLPVKARPRREDEDMNEDEAELGSMIACVIRVCV